MFCLEQNWILFTYTHIYIMIPLNANVSSQMLKLKMLATFTCNNNNTHVLPPVSSLQWISQPSNQACKKPTIKTYKHTQSTIYATMASSHKTREKPSKMSKDIKCCYATMVAWAIMVCWQLGRQDKHKPTTYFTLVVYFFFFHAYSASFLLSHPVLSVTYTCHKDAPFAKDII